MSGHNCPGEGCVVCERAIDALIDEAACAPRLSVAETDALAERECGLREI
jgi:hypothetical protein